MKPPGAWGRWLELVCPGEVSGWAAPPGSSEQGRGEHTQACLGACLVTVLELITGLIVNRWLGLQVWDYSGLPMNFLGQICLYYFVLWIPLSAAAVFLEDGLRRLLFGTPLPQYRLFS